MSGKNRDLTIETNKFELTEKQDVPSLSQEVLRIIDMQPLFFMMTFGALIYTGLIFMFIT